MSRVITGSGYVAALPRYPFPARHPQPLLVRLTGAAEQVPDPHPGASPLTVVRAFIDEVHSGSEGTARARCSLLSCLRIGDLAPLCESMRGYGLVRRPRFIHSLWSLVWVIAEAGRQSSDHPGAWVAGWPAFLVWSSAAQRWVMWDLGRWPRGEPPLQI